MSVREAKLADRAEFQRLLLACLIEEHAHGSDMLPTGRSLQFGLEYFNTYASGSRFGVCLLWSPEGDADLRGFVMLGEPWEPSAWDQDLGRGAWLWNLYSEPEWRSKGVASTELLDAAWRWAVEARFDTISFNIPEGCPSEPLARRFRAKPRGVWYTADLRAGRNSGS